MSPDRTPPSVSLRSASPLVALWSVVLGTAAVLRYVEMEMPALRDIMTPLYIILLVSGIIGTWRWARGRRMNRRADDRRKNDRRGPEG